MADKKGSTTNRRKQVLSDHKRIGKRFIPPLLNYTGKLGEVRWMNEILPELIWLGLLNDCHGKAEGARLGLTLAKAAADLKIEGEKRIWFAALSSFRRLTSEQSDEIVSLLRFSGDLGLMLEGLRPLLSFYPECPLAFLLKGEIPILVNKTAAMPRFKNLLASLFNRWDTPATFVQADAIYIAFGIDMLKVPSDSVMAQFPKVQDFPHTELSRMIAGSCRATVNMMMANFIKEEAPFWSAYFWNRGLELEHCETER